MSGSRFCTPVQMLHLGANGPASKHEVSVLDHRVQWTRQSDARKRTVMKVVSAERSGIQEILERKAAELAQVLGKRDGITIEKSADQMDEIQYATERELAIRTVDRESHLLRQVKAALRRIDDGSFGTCVECELAISPRRLVALPWALLCIQCQEAADRDRQERIESLGESLRTAA